MNIYFFIIIGILILDYLLSIIINFLNLKSLNPIVPKEFTDVLDNKKYLKSQDYTRVNTQFSYITSSFSIVVSFLFIFGGLYNYIDQTIISFGYGNITTGLLFFASLFIITDLLNLPFSLYKTFVIEEKFGFNKTTLNTFFNDKLKAYFLLVIIGTPVISLILYFFGHYGDNAWIYAWIMLVFFSLIIQPLFNLFIAPMFNEFTSIEEGPLLYKIKEYLKKVDFPVKKLEIMDGSKRSSHSNAYFSGIGNNKRIALFDTLVDQMDDDEIVSVIAHEVGHYKLKHINIGIFLSAVQSCFMLYIMSLFLMNYDLFSVFKMENLSIYASLVFFSILYTPISMIMGFIFNFISRKNEFAADIYSAKTSKKPEKLISALKKMSSENLSNLTPHWLNVALNYSHPPVLDRIDVLKRYCK